MPEAETELESKYSQDSSGGTTPTSSSSLSSSPSGLSSIEYLERRSSEGDQPGTGTPPFLNEMMIRAVPKKAIAASYVVDKQKALPGIFEKLILGGELADEEVLFIDPSGSLLRENIENPKHKPLLSFFNTKEKKKIVQLRKDLKSAKEAYEKEKSEQSKSVVSVLRDELEKFALAIEHNFWNKPYPYLDNKSLWQALEDIAKKHNKKIKCVSWSEDIQTAAENALKETKTPEGQQYPDIQHYLDDVTGCFNEIEFAKQFPDMLSIAKKDIKEAATCVGANERYWLQEWLVYYPWAQSENVCVYYPGEKPGVLTYLEKKFEGKNVEWREVKQEPKKKTVVAGKNKETEAGDIMKNSKTVVELVGDIADILKITLAAHPGDTECVLLGFNIMNTLINNGSSPPKSPVGSPPKSDLTITQLIEKNGSPVLVAATNSNKSNPELVL